MLDSENRIKFRVEHDFLGDKQVPINAYYGVQTLRAIENFPITGFHIHPSMIKSLALVKKAAAAANADIGDLERNIADAILQACDDIIVGDLNSSFVVDPIQGGAGTSINMNANEVIANRALEILGYDKGSYDIISPNTHINMAQSTNDAFPTAAHLTLIFLLHDLLRTMRMMRDQFDKKAYEFDKMIKMGRTHLQDAVPIRLGQEFKAYSRAISRDIKRISNSLDDVHEVNIGATAVGTGLNANVEYINKAIEYLCKFTGFPIRGAIDLVDATQNCDIYTEISGTLKVCMVNMSKICNDIRLMASGPRCGLGELLLPARQPGSSIMPGKVNPVMAEVINQIAFQVIGNDLTVTLGVEAGQFELNVMEPVFVFNLVQSISIMSNGFRVFTEFLLKDLTANEDRLKSYVERSVGIVTAINPHVGYEVASELAREAILTGKPIRELILRDKILTEEEMNIILDPIGMTTPGISGEELKHKKREEQNKQRLTHKDNKDNKNTKDIKNNTDSKDNQ